MKRKFWNWIRNEDESVPDMERTLFLNGMISDETWYGDEVTPQLFKDELNAGNGNITVWINSPGGDVFAAAQIYNMLRDYKGSVTVKIDGIAASAASVIAMAGDTVCVSPVAMMMIHNPATMAMGEAKDMQKAIAMLNEVKESILNAYEFKTGLTRARLSHMMDDETWFNAKKAVELGFADDVLHRADIPEDVEPPAVSMLYSKAAVVNSLMDKIAAKCRTNPKKTEKPNPQGRSLDSLYERLNLLKH